MAGRGRRSLDCQKPTNPEEGAMAEKKKDDTSSATETSTAVVPQGSPRLEPFRAWPDLFRWPEWLGRADHPMKIEEVDEDGMRVIRAELAGIDPDKDVDLTVDHGMLTIRAERRQESTSDEGGVYRSEFSYGSFRRTVPLPAGASEDDIKASYTDGVLEIRFPVDGEKAAAKKIPVTRG
jgi:HSP20 family protein